MAEVQVSRDVLYKVCSEIISKPQFMAGFSREQQHALAVFASEKARGSDCRMLEFSNPDVFAHLASAAADFVPQARTVWDMHIAGVREADVSGFRQIALQHSLSKLAEAVDAKERRENPDWWKFDR